MEGTYGHCHDLFSVCRAASPPAFLDLGKPGEPAHAIIVVEKTLLLNFLCMNIGLRVYEADANKGVWFDEALATYVRRSKAIHIKLSLQSTCAGCWLAVKKSRLEPDSSRHMAFKAPCQRTVWISAA